MTMPLVRLSTFIQLDEDHASAYGQCLTSGTGLQPVDVLAVAHQAVY